MNRGCLALSEREIEGRERVRSFRTHGSEVMSVCSCLASPIKTLYSKRPNLIRRLALSSRGAQSLKSFLIQQRKYEEFYTQYNPEDIVYLAEIGILTKKPLSLFRRLRFDLRDVPLAFASRIKSDLDTNALF